VEQLFLQLEPAGAAPLPAICNRGQRQPGLRPKRQPLRRWSPRKSRFAMQRLPARSSTPGGRQRSVATKSHKVAGWKEERPLQRRGLRQEVEPSRHPQSDHSGGEYLRSGLNAARRDELRKTSLRSPRKPQKGPIPAPPETMSGMDGFERVATIKAQGAAT
jgi:hypothetical protein